jgi:hypothetical protein
MIQHRTALPVMIQHRPALPVMSQHCPALPGMIQDELSGADIKAACTEAGLLALRERRMRVTQVDFRKAKEKVSGADALAHAAEVMFGKGQGTNECLCVCCRYLLVFKIGCRGC